MESLFQVLLFGGLFILMMRFGCGAHMFGRGASHKDKSRVDEAVGGCCGADKKNATKGNITNRKVPPKQDIDPVCGETVSTSAAKSNLHDGLVYFFCSTECRDAFELSPAKYAEKDEGKTPLKLGLSAVKDANHA